MPHLCTRTISPYWCGLLGLIIGVIIAPIIGSFGTLYNFLQSIVSYFAPPILATFLLGILWKRITATAAFTTLVTLVPAGILGFVVNEFIPDEPRIQFLYAGGIMFALSLVSLIGISLLQSPPDRERIQEVTWDPSFWRAETEELRGKSLLKNYRFWSVTLLISTAVIVFIFR